jgi:hypothetical protein
MSITDISRQPGRISANPDLIKSNYETHNLVASLTWLFGVPTAP